MRQNLWCIRSSNTPRNWGSSLAFSAAIRSQCMALRRGRGRPRRRPRRQRWRRRGGPRRAEGGPSRPVARPAPMRQAHVGARRYPAFSSDFVGSFCWIGMDQIEDDEHTTKGIDTRTKRGIQTNESIHEHRHVTIHIQTYMHTYMHTPTGMRINTHTHMHPSKQPYIHMNKYTYI